MSRAFTTDHMITPLTLLNPGPASGTRSRVVLQPIPIRLVLLKFQSESFEVLLPVPPLVRLSLFRPGFESEVGFEERSGGW
jgi:hypothetical protein